MIAADFFTNVNARLTENLPFVVYRKPKEIRVKAIFQNSDALHLLKRYSDTGFVFAPFNPENRTVLLKADEALELPAFELSNLEREISNSFEAEIYQKPFHTTLVKKAIAKIKEGSFDKIVLSRCLKRESKTSPLFLFQKLLASYSNVFCYLWYHPKVGLWLGATPEILVKVRNQQLTTMSLAGTQAYSGDLDPKWGNKEIEEQELVTNYIIGALKDKVGDLSRTKVESFRAGNLLHLRTKISARIEKGDLGVVLQALHPTPAVCGLPKNITKEFILRNENYNREYYTGYLGELNFKSEKPRNPRSRNQENQVYKSFSNTTTLFVNLRCMKLKKETAHIYVGGGITKDSDSEKEWEETVAKSKTMLRIL